ncbi:MAG: sigma-54-dependent Fis family transcriptional regulator [Chlamydiales bacterium]|nr:sigma-54-dependent Fis family transcriptional regulator [Chlamydiales bacterium]
MALYQEMQRLSFSTPIILLVSKQQVPQGPHIQKPVDIQDLIELIECTTSAASNEAPHIVSKSPQMKAILKDVKKLAKSNASVFISGESGTGKEMIAKAIHHYSKRKTAPFIRVNCAALPETLIESELFGHEKGSFTGAHVRRLGRFELADNGSLLLDEVTEIPLSLQSKLLRAIQEQEFERIGGMKSIKVDVRLIATSNRDMQVAISDKIFREDLYYRLNVLPIHLPPLRDRKEDILPLTEQFLQRAASSNHTHLKTLSEAAKDKILSYPWPGNIRELSNAIEHAVIMSSSDIISADDIALKIKCETPPVQLLNEMQKHMTLLEMEKRLIQQTLRAHNGNRTRTAKVLGISIRTLRNKLKAYPELGQ